MVWALGCSPQTSGNTGQAPTVADKNAKSKINVSPTTEAGERLVVTGKVTDAAGKPLAGASIYVYHTDAQGLYSETNDNRNPRLRGYLRTDAEGRYEYSTIKPASYPNTRIPAHIHYHVNAEGFRERVFEIVFTDDPFVDDRIRADARKEDSIFSIRPLARDKQGVWHCTQDVRMKK